jgi:hypothetical protein
MVYPTIESIHSFLCGVMQAFPRIFLLLSDQKISGEDVKKVLLEAFSRLFIHDALFQSLVLFKVIELDRRVFSHVVTLRLILFSLQTAKGSLSMLWNFARLGYKLWVSI